MSAREAEERIQGLKGAAVHELLFQQGINLNETPAWQRRGMVVAKERYEKRGYDRQRAAEVNVIRYKVVQYWDIPRFNTEEGRLFLSRFIPREVH
jgi:tRNA(His) guanylyltransferase